MWKCSDLNLNTWNGGRELSSVHNTSFSHNLATDGRGFHVVNFSLQKSCPCKQNNKHEVCVERDHGLLRSHEDASRSLDVRRCTFQTPCSFCFYFLFYFISSKFANRNALFQTWSCFHSAHSRRQVPNSKWPHLSLRVFPFAYIIGMHFRMNLNANHKPPVGCISLYIEYSS